MKSKWILVSERLPEMWKEVLGWTEPDKYGRKIAIVHWFAINTDSLDAKTAWVVNGVASPFNIPPKYWMPFPEPPEGEDYD